ncbi:MAG: GNAT family N-acetyltransferase [Pseudomonadota bacterium]
MSGLTNDRDGTPSALTIRPAVPRELDLLQAIDDDATTLYAEYGLSIELGDEHEFVRAELARWRRSAEAGRASLAIDENGAGLAFAALDVLDGEPYLDQLAVRRSAMRRGIGQRLLARSVEVARAIGGSALWLTTYDHLPFNGPYYERHGFVVVPESAWSEGIRRHIEEQRRFLPAPSHRVAMRRPLASDAAPL